MKGFAKFKYYGLMEWIAAIIGVLIASRTTYRFMIGVFDDYRWEEYLTPVCTVLFGLILMSAPLDVLDWFRNKFGMQMKNQRIEKEKFIKKTGFDPDKEIE